MPAHRDVVHHREDPVGEDVDDRVEDEDEEEQQPRLAEDVLGVAEVDAEDVQAVEPERRVEEDRGAVSHRRDDADQADDVEPAGHPAPALAAEVVRPPVGAARGRVLRGQLGHRERHHQDEEAEHRPADRGRDRSAVLPRERERRKRPREDRDDRERDREVREAGPGAGELLLVAQLMETLLVCGPHIRGVATSPALANRLAARFLFTLQPPSLVAQTNGAMIRPMPDAATLTRATDGVND